MLHRFVAVVLVASSSLLAPATAQDWTLLKPSTSGIPGEEVRLVRFAPDGLIWVGARWPFWGEGGFGRYDRGTDLWSTLSNADGTFPSAFPDDIAWAADGSAWVATANGLVHIDGNTQTLYTRANAPLLYDDVRSVDIDSRGHVWINNSTVSSSKGAIFEFDGTTWTKYTIEGQIPWPSPWGSFSDLLVDHLDHVWVSNSTLPGVAEFDGVRWVLHTGSSSQIGEIQEDTAGNLWLRAGVSGGNAFWRFDRTSFKQYPSNTTPTAIGIDDDGAVFLGDWGGTIRRSTDGGQSFQVWASGLNQVFDITPDPASTDVWVGTIGAVGHFDTSATLLHDFNTKNTGLGDYFIDHFDLDRDGNMWVASGENGLSRFDGLQWRNWGAHNAGSEPWPFAGNEPMGGFYLDRSGVGWMGGNGIARWDPATGTFTGFWNWQNNPGIGVTLFVDFAEDERGTLLAADEYGAIYRFNGTRWDREAVQLYLPLGDLPGMIADSRSTIWTAGWFDVYHRVAGQWRKLPLPNPNYFFDLGGINVIALGPDDVLWIGTNEGLVRWDGTRFDLFDTTNSPLPAVQVAGIDVRDDGVLAVSCLEFGPITPFPNGVAIVDGDPAVAADWTTYSYGSSPLPHYQLGRTRFDADGNLWVSAISEGVAVLMHPAKPLSASRPWISASFGGDVGFHLRGGASLASQPYVLLGTLSGRTPGVPLPSGTVLPLNPDPLTTLSVGLPGFVGILDAGGAADVTLALPRLPFAVGLTADFAWGQPGTWQVSNAVALGFQP